MTEKSGMQEQVEAVVNQMNPQEADDTPAEPVVVQENDAQMSSDEDAQSFADYAREIDNLDLDTPAQPKTDEPKAKQPDVEQTAEDAAEKVETPPQPEGLAESEQVSAQPQEETPPTFQAPEYNPYAPQQKVDPDPKAVEEMNQLRNQLRDQMLPTFQLNEEQAQKLNTEPEKVMPELAANLFISIYDALMYSMHNVVPQVLESYGHQQRQTYDFDKQFFGHFKELKPEQHYNEYRQLMSVYSQSYPDANVGDVMNVVGNTLMQKYKLSRPVAAQPQPAPTPTYRPTAPAKNSQAASSGTTGNDFSDMAMEFIEDDRVFSR